MEQVKVALPAVPLFRDLYLCSAGRSVCSPGHSFGPEVRRNYLIHYILSGYGCFEVEGKQYMLEPGQGFLIEPGWTTRYTADEDKPWTYIWAGFNGTMVPKLLHELRLGQGQPVFSCPEADVLGKAVEELFYTADSDALLSLNQHRFLLSFFQVLAEHMAPERGDTVLESRTNYHIQKAMKFIRANYANQLHVEDIASYLGISRFHLCHLFKEVMGHSPQEYVTGVCLGQARELLTTTEFAVGEIALLCGYSNAEIFSKAFKKKYLISPSQYRRYTKEHPGVNPVEYIRELQRKRENKEDGKEQTGFGE